MYSFHPLFKDLLLNLKYETLYWFSHVLYTESPSLSMIRQLYWINNSVQLGVRIDEAEDRWYDRSDDVLKIRLQDICIQISYQRGWRAIVL